MKHFNVILLQLILSYALLNTPILATTTVYADDTTSDDENVEARQPIEAGSPRLLHMVPKKSHAVYTLNEKSTFTNTLKTGWIIKAQTRVDFILFILVNERIKGLDDIGFGYVYFTTNSSDCELNFNTQDEHDEFISRESKNNVNDDSDEDGAYQEHITDEQKEKHKKLTSKLKFMSTRSKFYNEANTMNKKNSSVLAAETSIQLEYNANKYYVCLNFASRNSNRRYFFHQGTT